MREVPSPPRTVQNSPSLGLARQMNLKKSSSRTSIGRVSSNGHLYVHKDKKKSDEDETDDKEL